VTVDGQPVTVLQSGTDTQVDVQAPAAVLTTPGTYRLTVVDPVRQVGDAFVVASPGASVISPGSAAPGAPVDRTEAAAAPGGARATSPVDQAAPRPMAGGVSPMFIEDGGAPFRTALFRSPHLSNKCGISRP
jgi:hypothetical protein